MIKNKLLGYVSNERFVGNELRNNQAGFGIIEILLIILIVSVVGFGGYYVYNSNKKEPVAIKDTNSQTSSSSPAPKTTTQTNSTTSDNSSEYLVVKEWGLRFKVPSGLTGVTYQIAKNPTPNGDRQLAFYAKPTGSSVTYRSDYLALDENGNPAYSLGDLYRSTNPTEDKLDTKVNGKKIGDYYYYTAWSFSGLATGAACVGLYGNSSEADCKAEGSAFSLINQDANGLLNSIEIAQ